MMRENLIARSHENRWTLPYIHRFLDAMHRDMNNMIDEFQCRIQYPVDLISKHDSYSGFFSFFERIEWNWVLGYLRSNDEHSFFFCEFNSFRRMTELFQSHVLFCSEWSLHNFLRIFRRWRISGQPNLSSKRICSTDDIAHIVGGTDIFEDYDVFHLEQTK